MDYEVYLKWMAMTYEEFDRATAVIAIRFVCLLIALTTLIVWFIYFAVIVFKTKPDRTTVRKFKKLCKIETRSHTDQVKYALRKYVEAYEKEHRIDLDDI